MNRGKKLAMMAIEKCHKENVKYKQERVHQWISRMEEDNTVITPGLLGKRNRTRTAMGKEYDNEMNRRKCKQKNQKACPLSVQVDMQPVESLGGHEVAEPVSTDIESAVTSSMISEEQLQVQNKADELPEQTVIHPKELFGTDDMIPESLPSAFMETEILMTSGKVLEEHENRENNASPISAQVDRHPVESLGGHEVGESVSMDVESAVTSSMISEEQLQVQNKADELPEQTVIHPQELFGTDDMIPESLPSDFMETETLMTSGKVLEEHENRENNASPKSAQVDRQPVESLGGHEVGEPVSTDIESAVTSSMFCGTGDVIPESLPSNSMEFHIVVSSDIDEASCESEVFDIQCVSRLPGLQLPTAEQNTNVSKASSAVVTRTSNDAGKRKYDKKAYCIFCELPQTHIVRHWESKHKNEEKVKELMALPRERRSCAITKLRNMGNHAHNVKVLEKEEGDLVVAYRPGSETDVQDYVPCEGCYAYLRKKDLYRHKCPVRGRTSGRVAASAALLLPAPSRMSDGVRRLIGTMREDEVKQVIQDDPIIKRLAAKLLSKHSFERKDYIRAKLREISRFVLEMRKATNNGNMTVKDCINPTYFRHTIVAVKAVAGYSEGTNMFEKPSTALKVGHILKKCVKVCKTEAIINDDAAGIEAADRFLQLCELEWADAVSTQAHRSLINKQRNSVDLMPLSEDVCKLHG